MEQDFSIEFKYKAFKHYITNAVGRRIGGFVEVIQNNSYTFRVDFNLSGGYYYGWTILDIAETREGQEALVWVLDKQFPFEIKDYIRKILRGKMK